MFINHKYLCIKTNKINNLDYLGVIFNMITFNNKFQTDRNFFNWIH